MDVKEFIKLVTQATHGPGTEWDAGSTPPGDKSPGRWVVKEEVECLVVLFRPASDGYCGPPYRIMTFPVTEEGWLAAKKMALKLVAIAWG